MSRSGIAFELPAAINPFEWNSPLSESGQPTGFCHKFYRISQLDLTRQLLISILNVATSFDQKGSVAIIEFFGIINDGLGYACMQI